MLLPTAGSGKAPDGPEQQQGTGVHGQNEQVDPEQDQVQPAAEGQPVGLVHVLAFILAEGEAEGHQLLMERLQAGAGTVRQLAQGQQVLPRRKVKLITFGDEKEEKLHLVFVQDSTL